MFHFRGIYIYIYIYVCVFGRDACAQSILVNPSPPILGSTATYSIQAPSGWQISSYSWQYRWDDGACVSSWLPLTSGNPTTATQYITEPWPGTFDVRCTINYVVPPNYTQQQTVVATAVTIAPPNGVRILSGLNTPTPVNNGIWIVFQLQSNGVDCGPYCAGQAQELITNKILYGNPAPNDTQWTPPAGQSSNVFYAGSGRINDYKTTSQGIVYQNWLSGTNLYTRTQNIRMLFTDACGNQRIFSCGSVNLANQKVNNGSWQILQQ